MMFVDDDDSSQDRFEQRVWDCVNRLHGNVYAYLAWWLVHNCVAHPLLGVAPCAATVRLHDVTSDKLNMIDQKIARKWSVTHAHSPMPVITNRRAWLRHNCIDHPRIGLFPTRAAFDTHDVSARAMNVKDWT